MDRIEKVILRNLIYNEEYLRKVLPFIEPDYFNNRGERIVFEHITKYAAEYNSLITKEVLQIEIEDRRDITQDEVKNIFCLLYTSPSPRDATLSRMPSSA